MGKQILSDDPRASKAGEEANGCSSQRNGALHEEGCTLNKAGKRRLRWPNIPARVTLGVISFFGFFTNYMLRVNINIAIVAMVNGIDDGRRANDTSTKIQSNQEGTCIQNMAFPLNGFQNQTFLLDDNSTANAQENEETFSWDSVDQGLVLGAFYWSYVISVVPGAILASTFGPKLIYGGANVLTALLALFTPLAARTSFYLLLTVRVLQGLASGTTWPAMNTMASRWIPPHERSKFISSYLGNSVGTAITYPLCGVLIDYYGWTAAFYVPGFITLVWCIFWWFLAFDSPNVHPRISRSEQVYIENAVSPSLNKEKMVVPWGKIIRSGPFWALVVANLGSLWGWMTVLVYGPTYLKNVHGFSIQANGILSGLPNMMRFVFAVIFSIIMDHLLKSKVFSVTFIRKMATCTAELLPGLLFLLMTNMGCNAPAEVAVMTIAAAFGGATSSGPLANSVDLAPNFAGMTLGLISVIAMSSGFLVPSVVGALINNNNSQERWRLVFIIGSVISIACSLFFSVFGSGDVQEWNGSNGVYKVTEESSALKNNSKQDATNGDIKADEKKEELQTSEAEHLQNEIPQ